MARYYFDLFSGDGPVPDEHGQEVSSRDGISREVSRILADIAREELPGRGKGLITIKVRDEGGHQVFTGTVQFTSHWHDEEQ
jgi:hypothetical protein